MIGATGTNTVLIAQLRTIGELSFELNLQVADPDGTAIKYVARNAQPGEVELPILRRALTTIGR